MAGASIKSLRELQYQMETAGDILVGDSLHQLRPWLVFV